MRILSTTIPCWILAVLLSAAAQAASFSVRAAEPSAEDRERARALLFNGREKLKAGYPAAAVRSFQAAHGIMGVPTTGLDLAKGLVALGLLMEARTTALDVAQFPVEPREPRAFSNARAAATALVEELAARIPSLVIQVRDPPGIAAQVFIDGVSMPIEALGLPWKVNPGEHVVAVTAAGFQAQRRTLVVNEGDSLTVDLALSPGSSQADVAPPAVPAHTAKPGARATPAGRPLVPDERQRMAQGVPAWAWVSGGAGVVALSLGVVFALDHAAARRTVAGDCPAHLCDWSNYDDEKATALEARWNRSLGLAVGFGVAGLGALGAAAYGLMTAPGERSGGVNEGKAAPPAEVSPWFAGEHVGVVVSGRF